METLNKYSKIKCWAQVGSTTVNSLGSGFAINLANCWPWYCSWSFYFSHLQDYLHLNANVEHGFHNLCIYKLMCKLRLHWNIHNIFSGIEISCIYIQDYSCVNFYILFLLLSVLLILHAHDCWSSRSMHIRVYIISPWRNIRNNFSGN